MVCPLLFPKHTVCEAVILPAFLENILTGGPLLIGGAGPPGPGIGAILGMPDGGGGGGLN